MLAYSNKGNDEPKLRRYAATLLFQFRVQKGQTSDKRRRCEKRIVLFEATDARTALRDAKRYGRQGQHRYHNSTGGVVHFEFIGVQDLLHLGSECDPDEVWYDIITLNTPLERRESLLPPESELAAIVQERKEKRKQPAW